MSSLKERLRIPWWCPLSVALLISQGCDVSTRNEAFEGPEASVDGGAPRADGGACTSVCEAGAQRCVEGAVEICADHDSDGCAEWSSGIPCSTGTACVDGRCEARCQDTCVEGEAVCSGGGVRRCVADAEGCRTLNAPEPCEAGMRCDDGRCVDDSIPCEDSCAQDGARRCVPEGYQRCGDVDDDPCLEWSATQPCGFRESCQGEGECVPACVDACEEGARQCVEGGVATCAPQGAEGCLGFGAPTPCGAEERCEEGACVPDSTPCEHLCDTDGLQICEGEAGFRRCGWYDDDPCLELSAVIECGAREICQAGDCVPTCEDECAANAARCEEGGLARCGNHDEDPCLEWGAATPCAANERCDDGRCVQGGGPCEDACAPEALRCDANARAVEICGQHDADICVEWGAWVPCGADERCVDGACVADCVDECEGVERRCVGGGVATCGQFDADSCADLSPPEPCEGGLSCVDGACVADCVDDCDAAGETRCGVEGVERCSLLEDGCLHWSSPTPCGAREACVDGACVVVCQDECAQGERRCVGDSFEICGDFDADACLEYGGGQACGPGEACEGGLCDATCLDACATGARECVGSDAWWSCGNFDADACLEWSATEACGPNQRCEGGACVFTPPPDPLLINEVLYDADGGDAPWAFIELFGAPGARLEGYELVGVNGNGGWDYASILLEGVIPDDGVFVVAHPEADASLAAEADLLHADVDLQNGPDSLQLRFGGEVVDALAYGDFSDGSINAGEGAPAVDVMGASLSRDAAHTDTNDNAADFHEATPTPGVGGDACAPEGATRCAGDLVLSCDGAAWVEVEDCAALGAVCVDGVCATGGGICGDGHVDAGEGCDDGNTSSGDGCDAWCQLEGEPSQFQALIEIAELVGEGGAPSAAAHATGGGWYLAGSGPISGRSDDGVLMWIAPSGAARWARAFGGAGEDHLSGVVGLPDGGALAVGATASFGDPDNSDAYIIRVGPDGDLVCSQTLGDVGVAERLSSVALTLDGEAVAAGYGGRERDAVVIRFTLDGAIRWARAYGSGARDEGSVILPRDSGGFAVVGRSRDWPAVNESPLFLRITEDGLLEGARVHDDYPDARVAGASMMANGDVLISGAWQIEPMGPYRMFFARLASAGASRWRATYADTPDAFASRAVQTSGGDFVVVGSREGALFWDRWASNRRHLSSQDRDTGALGEEGSTAALTVLPEPDNGVFIAGRDDAGRFWLLKASPEDAAGGCNVSESPAVSLDSDDPIVEDRGFDQRPLGWSPAATGEHARRLTAEHVGGCSML